MVDQSDLIAAVETVLARSTNKILQEGMVISVNQASATVLLNGVGKSVEAWYGLNTPLAPGDRVILYRSNQSNNWVVMTNFSIPRVGHNEMSRTRKVQTFEQWELLYEHEVASGETCYSFDYTIIDPDIEYLDIDLVAVNDGSTGNQVYLEFNGDATAGNYRGSYFSAHSAAGTINYSTGGALGRVIGFLHGTTQGATTYPSYIKAEIPHINNTYWHKNVRSRGTLHWFTGVTYGFIGFMTWVVTPAAITSLKIHCGGNPNKFQGGSICRIHGAKRANYEQRILSP